MSCNMCDELIASYERSARFYAAVAKILRSAPGEEFQRGMTEAEALRSACRAVEDKLHAHWQTHQSDYRELTAARIRRNPPDVSTEAAVTLVGRLVRPIVPSPSAEVGLCEMLRTARTESYARASLMKRFPLLSL